MKAVVQATQADSIAYHLGLAPGDEVLAVNGRTDLEDLLDYQFEVADSTYLELHVRHNDGSEEIYEIEKEPEDDLGLVFESPLFTPIKTCNNACPFCFIDQQPEGLRPTLYVKDDDYRLSYFNGTYITLTNLTPRDRERIARLKPGPLFVSVHATAPEVRQALLVNKKAGNIMDELRWLKSLEVPFHAQIVLCPGLNDGDVLNQTLADLATLRPELLSVAVVPVGLTQYRGSLPGLMPVDSSIAQSVVVQVESFNRPYHQAGREPFVYLSDEFYIKAGLPFPQYESYGDFHQLDDGVGTARMLLGEFFRLADTLPECLPAPRRLMMVTGRLGAMVLEPIQNRLNQIEGLFVDVAPVENRFWGQAVDVAGLVTGQDLIHTLQKQDARGYDAVLIPAIMLKHGSEMFLDDMTVTQVSEAVSLPMVVVQDPYSAQALIEHVLGRALTQTPLARQER